jgi:hypothetical protein
MALSVLGASALPSLAPAQTVTGTKAAVFPPNNDASARPGNTITYTISVGNAAAAVNNALAVQVADTVDGNSTFVNNSAKVSPNAIAHSYLAAGNTQLVINAATGLLNGVHDIDLVTPDATLVITTGTFPTSAGGSVTIAADGSFTYTPQTGDQNLTDTFSYTVTDGDGLPSTGLVSINLGARVWYVDSTYAGGNGPEDGSSLKPFNSLADISGASGPDAAGDIIFIIERPGDYDGNLTLLNNQFLFGSGSALTVNTIVINAAGGPNTTLTTTAGGTNSITLANTNQVSGFTIGNTTGAKIIGTSFGTLTVSNVTMSGTGQALALNTGTVNGTIDSLTTTSSGTGVSLTAVAGTFTITTGAISGATGDDFFVSAGTGVITYGGTITNNSAHSVNVQNKTGGSVTFSGLITDTAGSTGVLLSANTGATMNFTGGLSLTTTTNAAFTATGGGTVNATQNNTTIVNTLTTTTGTALNVANTTIGSSGLTFRSITANTASGNPGIVLNTTGATAGLTVTGQSTTAGSGGTISNKTGNGITLTSTRNVSLSNMNLTSNGQTQTASNVNCGNNLIAGDTTQCVANLFMNGVTTVGLTNLSVTGSTQEGIAGTSVAGLTMTNCTISGNGNEDYEDGLIFKNLTGTVSITGTTVRDNFSRQSHIRTDSGTLNLTVSSSRFGRNAAPGVSSQQGMLLEVAGSSHADVDMGTSTIDNNGNGNGFALAVTDTASVGTSGAHSSIHNMTSLTNNAAHVFPTTSGSATAYFDTLNNAVMTVAGLQSIDYYAPGGTLRGTISGNTIGTNNVAQSGCNGNNGCDGMTIDQTNSGALFLSITGNTIQQINTNGIALGTDFANNLNATITGNTIRQPSNGAAVNAQGNAFFLNVGISSNSVAGSTACVAFTGNTIQDTASKTWDPNGSAAAVYSNTRHNAITRLPGAWGSGTAAATTFLTNNNTFNLTGGAAPVLVQTSTGGTIVSGAACTAPLLFAQGGVEKQKSVSAKTNISAEVIASAAVVPAVVTPIVIPPVANETAVQALAQSQLSQLELDQVVAASISRWEAAGLSAAQRATLRSLKFEVADLPSLYLGEAAGNHIRVSSTAGGNGWFIAPSTDNAQFTQEVSATRRYASEKGAPAGRLDLLTTIMHEMGHAIGLSDSYAEKDRDSLMYGFLTKGERRLPSKGQAIGAVPGSVAGTHFLGLPVNIGTLNPGTTVTVKFDATVNSAGFCGNITNTANISGSNFATVNTNTTTVPVHFPPSLFSAQTPPSTGTEGFPYAGYNFVANGCPAPTYALAPGSPVLPPGLTLAANGALTGTPTTAGTYSNIIVRATNTAGVLDTTPFTITIAAPITFNTNSPLAAWTKDFPGYSQTISTSGGTGAITYTVSAGSLPTNLSLNANTGEISGQPSVAGTFNFTIKATDTLGANTSKAYAITINAAITVTPATLPAGQVNVAYSQFVSASGGTGAKSFSSTGTLPPGLTLNTATGEISGTPTTTGSYSFTVTATDTIGATGSQAYTIVIKQATTTALVSSQNPSSNGFAVTFTATVSAVGAPPGTPTGTAAFFDGATPITCENVGGQTLNGSGVATCTISTLSVAGSPHSITAQYSGDTNYLASTSNTVSQTVLACANPATVTNLNDAGAGSLRQAITEVCDGGVINFQPGLTGTITLANPLTVSKSVTITGPGAAVITVDGNNTVAILTVTGGSFTVNLSGMTFTRANPPSGGAINLTNLNNNMTLTGMVLTDNHSTSLSNGGGAIFNVGTLNVIDSVITANTASFEGGGIHNATSAQLTVTRSTISGNTALAEGGGIYNGNATAITINDSTISGNSTSTQGGGIFGRANITNSTISGNHATNAGQSSGGGIFGGGTWTNVTIASNTSANTSGGVNQSGSLSMGNSIIADNTAPLNADAALAFTSLGNNLVETRSASTGFVASDLPDGTDPVLGPLQNNGGPTFTQRPANTSPALDAGNNALVTNPPFSGPPFTDQRGFGRILDGPDGDATPTVDIGAVEVNYVIATTGGTPQSAVIGTAFAAPLQVTVSESGVNPISGVSVTYTVTPAGNGASGSFTSANPATTDASGNASVTFSANNIPGTYTVSATAAGYNGPADFTLTNTAGPATHFTVTAPANSAAGQPFTITVTALDTAGNTDTNYTGTVHFTKTDAGAGSAVPADYTFTLADAGVHTFPNGVTFVTSGTQTVTATDTVTGSITGSANVLVGAAGATHFSVVAPASATAAIGFNFSVTALDQFNNTATGYTGTVHFTSTDGAANLPGNYTFSGGDAGTHTFSATLNTVGNQTITATDTVNGSIAGTSNTISVSPGVATHFTVTAPANSAAGSAFSFTVTALDAANNVATGYTSTVHFTSTDSQAQLPVNYTFLGGDNGTHTFVNGATLKTAGSQTITATDTVNAAITGTSAAINVSPGAATHLGLVAPASVLPNNAFNFTVNALDAFNNTATGYLGTVHFTKSDAGAGSAVPADYTFIAGDNGSHQFSATLVTGGNQSITATDTINGTITGTANITVGQPPAITSANATMFKVGTAGTFTITTTGFPTNASMVITETGTLPGGVTFTNNNNGTATLSGTPGANTGGTWPISIKASNGIAPDATQSFTLTVNQGPAFTSADHTTFTEGLPGTFTVTTTGFPTNASMSITRTGNLPAGVTFVNNNDGTATLSGTPGPLTGGTYPFTIGANNGVTATVNQSFVLTVIGVTPTPSPTPTATATATPTATATATATATPTATATATPTTTATATPSATPTATPTVTPAQATNISTRLRVDTGDKVMIGGFIITGNVAKPVVLRGIGPSLTGAGIPAASTLKDPVIELHGSSGALITSNDNWKDSPQKSQIEGTIFEPSDDSEAVIMATLPPAAYTVILKGVNETSGIGVVEAYDNNLAADSDLTNISTRGFVQAGNEVMIGGFILGGNNLPTRIAVRALGPSLTSAGLSNVLADPTLELHNANGTIMISNDNWQDDPVTEAALTANGLALSDPKESAIFTSLAPPGQFTAIVADKNGGIGIALVEIYNLK